MPKKTRGDLLADALPEWEGTPYHEHARLKQVGTDCKGMLWGACDELGFPEAQTEYARSLDYSLTKPTGIPVATLREGFTKLFRQVKTIRRGDILLCKWAGKPGHIAVCDGEGRAWSALPGSGVKRRKLSTLEHLFPIDSIWRLKGR